MTELLEMESQNLVSTGDEDLRQFLQEIRQFPLLTARQERELARLCAEGDENAIRHMVNSNLRLVVSVAREYAGRGVPLLDLIQEGSIGLLAAAWKFDYTLEFRFSTYATKWIRQGITRYLMNHTGLIRVPAHTAERIHKIESARTALLQENGCEPTIEQIAAQCGMMPDKVLQFLQLLILAEQRSFLPTIIPQTALRQFIPCSLSGKSIHNDFQLFYFLLESINFVFHLTQFCFL